MLLTICQKPSRNNTNLALAQLFCSHTRCSPYAVWAARAARCPRCPAWAGPRQSWAGRSRAGMS